MSLLLAFSIWLIHNLSLNYSDTMGVPVVARGAGTGLSKEGILHKQQVIEAAVAHHAAVHEPLDVLATFGGFEIAMMAGAMLQAAAERLGKVLSGNLSI